MRVGRVLAVLLLFLAPATAQDVTFEGRQFKMTCPNVEGKWYKNDKELDEGLTLTLDYDSDTKGSYRCDYKVDETDRTYYFYVKGKACANCVELDASSFGLVIAADMAGTVVLMAIIYKCTKKRSSAGPTPSSKAPARSGGRAPPVPSPDYETLNAHTRSQDPYSVVNRTG